MSAPVGLTTSLLSMAAEAGTQVCPYIGSHPTEASSAYARHQPDWVLMDFKLPGLDGFAATRQILTQWPGTCVVIVTEFDEPQFRQRALEAGACAYVLKDNLQALRPLLLQQSS